MENVPTNPFQRIRFGRVPCLVALSLLLGALQACAGPQNRRQNLTRSYEVPTSSTDDRPVWVDEPLSWAKLDALESWLKTSGRSSTPYWRVEAELQLAEGRLSFADPLTHAGEETRRLRRRNARMGFLRIPNNPDASVEQKRRASDGLDRLTQSGAVEASSKLAGVLTRSAWGARRPNMNKITRANTPWSFITLHHSALEDAPTIGTSKQDAISALRMVQRSHMDGRGWGDVGYHFLIDPAGRIWQGRELQYQGAHAGGKSGRNNVGNVGICLLGNFDEVRPTSATLASLDNLVDELCRRYTIPRTGIVAHTDWKATLCPGRYLLPHVRRLAL
ncbi:MAG: hypothetical protein ACI8QC_000177 [Planctomycetota bacterium]|jgi:hypothetical protein